MEKLKVTDSLSKQIQEYIADPNTRVWINYNNESGQWWYSIEVIDSRGFWLDSFETEQEAKDYIREHDLIEVE